MEKEEKKTIEEQEETQTPQKVQSDTNEQKEVKTRGKQKGAEMVTIPLAEYADQLKQIDELKEKNQEYSDGWQRERADFDNYRKRIQRNQEQEKENLHIEIIKEYLVIHDDLELALKNVPQNLEGQEWVMGIALILQKMNKILEDKGIQPIEGENGIFNAQEHEAISHEENADYESDHIIEVVKKGYRIGERVIRPALVRVAK